MQAIEWISNGMHAETLDIQFFTEHAMEIILIILSILKFAAELPELIDTIRSIIDKIRGKSVLERRPLKKKFVALCRGHVKKVRGKGHVMRTSGGQLLSELKQFDASL